jgi:hypothetical protein
MIWIWNTMNGIVNKIRDWRVGTKITFFSFCLTSLILATLIFIISDWPTCRNLAGSSQSLPMKQNLHQKVCNQNVTKMNGASDKSDCADTEAL